MLSFEDVARELANNEEAGEILNKLELTIEDIQVVKGAMAGVLTLCVPKKTSLIQRLSLKSDLEEILTAHFPITIHNESSLASLKRELLFSKDFTFTELSAYQTKTAS